MNRLQIGMGGLVVLLQSQDLSFQDVTERYAPFVVENGQRLHMVIDFERLASRGSVIREAEMHRLRELLANRFRWYCAGHPHAEDLVRQKLDAAAGFLSCPPFVDCLQSYHPLTGKWRFLGLSPAGAWFLDRDLVRARVFVDGQRDETGDPPLRSYYSFILRSLLARHQGILLHAAAVADGDKAYVFAGPSGSGKTTLALAARSKGWPVLADDRVIVRQMADGEFRAYATPWNMERTPWNGSFGQRPESAPVRANFVVRAGQDDRYERLAPVLAASSMVEGALLTMRRVEAGDAARLLELLAGLGNHVPSYRLWFSRADDALKRISELDAKGDLGNERRP